MAMILVRKARPEDSAAMASAYLAAAREAWAHMFPADRLSRLPSPKERFAGQIADTSAGRTFLAAEVDGAVVGFASTRPSEDADAGPDAVGELAAFYTHPSVWGSGAGRALLAEAVTAIRAAGFSEATAWTAEENHRPRRIYETAGWQLDGEVRERTYLDVGFRELRYRIAL